MLDNVFSKSYPQSKKIALTNLIAILQRVCRLSFVTRSEQSSSYDFDKCLPYLTEKGLQGHILFVSRSLEKLPLNSEQHLYEMRNIVFRNLHIDLDDRATWAAHDDWEPLSHAKWHFENCCFDASDSNMYSIHFPWSSSFRFYRNTFDFDSRRFGGHWLFVFQTGSRILLQRNNFKNHHIQTRCVAPMRDLNDADTEVPEVVGWGDISLIGNRAIASFDILEGYSSVSFTGMNHIDSLWLRRISDGDNHGEAVHKHEPLVYFGPREKIDRHFHHCVQHRRMFLHLRRLAAATHDTRQLVVLDKQIDRIEYFLNKEQDTPSLVDFRIWMEYWQDRLLYAWRRWSSDFYKSWMRPLFMALSGYLLMNAAPVLFVDTFSFSHWIEFSLRPIGEIPEYERSLDRIIGDEYGRLSPAVKTSFGFLGWIQVIWIAMWSFAFARSIRR